MGNSKVASYVDKSNFKLFKEKFKEKERVSQKSKSDINGRNYESEKKKKKRFWSKWLTSVRQSWSCGEARSCQAKSQTVSTKSFDESMDLFEMPIDPEIKPSKIFIEPNKMEPNVVTSNYFSSSSYSEELFPKESFILRSDSQETRSSKQNKTKINQDPLITHKKSMVKNTKPANGVKESPQNMEPLLTSALFIYRDLDRMVESTVFMKPNLPRDYAESKPSDEISQESLSTNNVCVSCKDQETDEIIKTVKTTSEPTWKERKKRIHQQRLNENINYLVKQFVYLETQDVNGKKDIKFNHRSGSNTRDLSREVSPEILVNIKPFKEYLTENAEDSEKTFKNPKLTKREVRTPKNWRVRAPENLKKVAEKRNHPALKPTVTLLKENVYYKENSLKPIRRFLSPGKHDRSILTLAPVKNEANTSWNKDASDDFNLESQSFSFWDMYKTYPNCKNLVKAEVELENPSFPLKQRRRKEVMQADVEAEEEALRSSTSLDAVFNTLEDVDHDLIFRKNLSQFRKKIPVMPRLDFRKSTFNRSRRGPAKMEDKVWQKLVRVQNPLEIENHIVRKVAKVADFSLENSMEKKIEMCRSKCLDLRTGLLWKSEKILENIYLMLFECTVINQVLATRVEAKIFSLCQTLREVHDMQENNIVVVVEVENPTNSNETLKKVESLNETSGHLQKSYLVEPKKSETIAMFLYTEQISLQKDLTSICNEMLETGASFETDKRCPDFPGTCQYCQLHLITFKFKEALSSKFLEFLKEVNTDEEEGNKPRAVESSLKEKRLQTLTQVEIGDETSRRAVIMLNHPFYDYTAQIYEKDFGFLQLDYKFYSESNFKTLVYGRRHQSDSAVTCLKEKRESSKVQEIESGNSPSKKCPNFKKQVTRVSAGNTEANKEGKEGKEGEDDQNKHEKEEKEEKLQKSKERIWTCKSNFLPKETKTLEKRRVKMTHVSPKEIETHISDFVHCSKKRGSADEAEETMNEETSVRDKSLAFPKQLMLKQEGEADKRITFQVTKSGANLKKELVAAINLIKGLKSCKGEAKRNTKQISLIILLSKN